MNGDHAPSSLHTELLEKGCGHDAFVADKCVWVEEGSADDGHDDDAEASAENLAAVAYHRTSCHGAKVGHDLRDGHRVGREVVLILQHQRVNVLRAMRHEIETGHQQDQVYKDEPMLHESHSSFGHESAGQVSAGFSHCLSFAVCLGFWQAETEDDDQDRRPSAKPVQRSPAMRGGVDQASGECGRQQISKRVSLLQHA